MIGYTIVKLEKFFKVKKTKEMNYVKWLDKLYEMQLEWEEKKIKKNFQFVNITH